MACANQPRTNEADYFPIGQDTPESLLTKDLINTLKPDEAASILFCGIGDARNLFQTIIEFKGARPRNLHVAILDHNPAVIARDLVLFRLLDEATAGDTTPDAHLLYYTIAYTYIVPVLPPFAWDGLQATIAAVLADLQSEKQPIPWVYVPTAHIKSVCRVLRQWQAEPKGPYSTKSVRAAVIKDRQTQPESMPSMFSKADEEFSHGFGTIALPLSDTEKLEPRLGELLGAYRKSVKGSRSKLSAYINKTWRSNMTLIDVDWESTKEESETLGVTWDPFNGGTVGQVSRARITVHVPTW
ncbi:hypothetical protein PG985_001907 [Apiospora marii]|uniref:uncharacterized protein n=1 Tax=Apiospora marii TaxID=335849 RepID=UPI00313028E7